nr:helix-turn-helix transcriptional regulator [uncultured Comamonas sp.]
MANIKEIRTALHLTQQALADGIGCTQTNIGHYERGQTVPPPMARRLIGFAGAHGLLLTFDHIYSDKPLPERTNPPTHGQEVTHG